jgi:hypothetical protein
MAIIRERKKQQITLKVCWEKEAFGFYWKECKLVQPLGKSDGDSSKN